MTMKHHTSKFDKRSIVKWLQICRVKNIVYPNTLQENSFSHTRQCMIEQANEIQLWAKKQKYRGMFETQKSRNKTSSGDIGLNIRTLASPKVEQDQVSGGVKRPLLACRTRCNEWSIVYYISRDNFITYFMWLLLFYHCFQGRPNQLAPLTSLWRHGFSSVTHSATDRRNIFRNLYVHYLLNRYSMASLASFCILFL